MEPTTDLVAECPTCKTAVAIEATECPRCGELFEQDIGSEAPVAGSERASAAADEESADETKTGFREKFLFYTGIFLILLGGPGIALGSWLHDYLEIAVGEFQAFEVFGPWNRLVTAIGLIVLIVGIVFLILSLRFSRPSDVERDLNALRES
jgi:hypothetical protein